MKQSSLKFCTQGNIYAKLHRATGKAFDDVRPVIKKIINVRAKSQIKSLVACSLLLMTMIACKKKTGEAQPLIVQGKDTLTESEKQIASLHDEIADILAKVYYNDSAYREVNIAIFSGYYADERVLLWDLLFPGTSGLYASEKFREISNFTGVFARIFFSVMGEGNYPLLKQALAKRLPYKARIVSSEVVLPGSINLQKSVLTSAIYFPYSENFPVTNISSSQQATIVAAKADADTATGRAPYLCPEFLKKFCYKNVLVDDNYAASRPTHIVTQGAEPVVNNSYPEPVPNMINRTYNGWSRVTKQLDRLVSLTGNGGGSEIKICRINGYLKIKEEQVDNFEGDVVTAYFSRKEIRNKTWKRIYSVWDPNWNYQDLEQVYAVYEEDTKGEATFDGSLTTTLNFPGKSSAGKTVGEIAFRITVSTQDEIITQRKLDRASYFKSAGINQGYGTYPDGNDFLNGSLDWPIYDGGAVWNYTMPFQVY